MKFTGAQGTMEKGQLPALDQGHLHRILSQSKPNVNIQTLAKLYKSAQSQETHQRPSIQQYTLCYHVLLWLIPLLTSLRARVPATLTRVDERIGFDHDKGVTGYGNESTHEASDCAREPNNPHVSCRI